MVEGFSVQTLRLWEKSFSNWSWYRSAPTGRVSPVQVFQLWRERYSYNLESRDSTTLTLYNKPHRRDFFFFEREKVKSLPLLWQETSENWAEDSIYLMFLWPTWSFPGWHLVCFQVQSLGFLLCMAGLGCLYLKGLCLLIRAVRVTLVWTLFGDPQWWDLAYSVLQRTFILLFFVYCSEFWKVCDIIIFLGTILTFNSRI